MRQLLALAAAFCADTTALQAGSRLDALVAARITASGPLRSHYVADVAAKPVMPPRPWSTRRAWAAAAAVSALLPAARTRALVSAPICASGVGDGCEELAADSPLIAELQARSAEKREQRRKESLERYSVNNFNDFFAVDNKSLVRHADGAAAASLLGDDATHASNAGTFEALPKDVIAEGLKNGRIKYGARSAGIADFSTSRAPFEFNESPASPPSSSNENLQ
jgi:hypothetical protein